MRKPAVRSAAIRPNAETQARPAHWACAVLAVLPLSGALAQGQSVIPGLPAKTIQIIVPNVPGGGPDILARLIAPKLTESLHQSVVVDNKPSVNGVLASELVARSVPDGTVIAMGNSGTHAVNATLYKKLSYDPVRDFAAVSELVTTSLVLVANPRLNVNSVKELIAEAKKAPGKINIAIAAATGEIATNALKLQAGIDMNNIPYKGGGQATVAVMANEAQLVITNYALVGTQADAGKLKILGTTSGKRSSQLPNIPTIAESGGLDGYAIDQWYGVFLPAKTPPAIVQALSRELVRIINLPDVKEKLLSTGHDLVGSTPEQFTEKVKREVEMYRKIILESKMQQE
jgi:tripartite-type tricarboxylate transporter receptor subunit TctC